MNWKFFNHTPKSKHLILLSIETGRITFSVVDTHADWSEKILYAAKYPFPSEDAPNAPSILRNILLKIDQAFDNLVKSATHQLLTSSDVLILLGSPWHESWSEQVTIAKDKPFKVTESFIDEAVSNAFTSANKDLSIIGSHVMAYTMNGYAMDNPFGKQTSSLELHAYVESAPKVVLDPINSKVQKHVPHAKIYHTTSVFASVEAIKSFSNAKDFLLILPEYELTDIVLVRKGTIDRTASIPYGTATLARELFSKESSGIEEAFAKTKRLLDGTLNAPEFDRATKMMGTAKDKFQSDFRSLLWKMNESLLLPGDVFVIRTGTLSHFIADWIKTEDYSSESFTSEGFKVKLVAGRDVAEVLAIDQGDQKIPFETIAASVVGRQLETRAR